MISYFPRLVHHPIFYKKIPKKHHEWTAPIGTISLHVLPLERSVSGALLSLEAKVEGTAGPSFLLPIKLPFIVDLAHARSPTKLPHLILPDNVKSSFQ